MEKKKIIPYAQSNIQKEDISNSTDKKIENSIIDKEVVDSLGEEDILSTIKYAYINGNDITRALIKSKLAGMPKILEEIERTVPKDEQDNIIPFRTLK